MADALDVRCPTCGGTCRASDVDHVHCPFCGAQVTVPEQVRFFAQGIRVFEHAGAWRAERIAQLRAIREGRPVPGSGVPYDPLPSAEVEAKCPSCGFTLKYGEQPIECCPKCGDDSVPKTIEAARAFVSILHTGRMSFKELDAEIETLFPIAKKPDEPKAHWRCGRCDAELEQTGIDAEMTAIDGLSHPEFAACSACGAKNTSSKERSKLNAYRAIDAALDSQERNRFMAEAEAEVDADLARHRSESEPAPTPTRKQTSSGCAAIVVLGCLAGFVVWLVRPSAVVEKNKAPPVAPMPRIPELVSDLPAAADECSRLRALGGECVSDTTLRSCNDAGRVQEEHCGFGVWPCLRDACGTGARCCAPGTHDGGS